MFCCLDISLVYDMPMAALSVHRHREQSFPVPRLRGQHRQHKRFQGTIFVNRPLCPKISLKTTFLRQTSFKSLRLWLIIISTKCIIRVIIVVDTYTAYISNKCINFPLLIQLRKGILKLEIICVYVYYYYPMQNLWLGILYLRLWKNCHYR